MSSENNDAAAMEEDQEQEDENNSEAEEEVELDGAGFDDDVVIGDEAAQDDDDSSATDATDADEPEVEETPPPIEECTMPQVLSIWEKNHTTSGYDPVPLLKRFVVIVRFLPVSGTVVAFVLDFNFLFLLPGQSTHSGFILRFYLIVFSKIYLKNHLTILRNCVTFRLLFYVKARVSLSVSLAGRFCSSSFAIYFQHISKQLKI